MTLAPKQLDICALKKPVTNQDNNIDYNLISLEPYDGCSPIDQPSLDSSAAYLRIKKPFKCHFSTLIKNVQANNPKLVIIGSDGPIVI